MPLETFKTSQSLSIGVELELQLVSLSDFDLVDASPDMLALLERRRFPGNDTMSPSRSAMAPASTK